MSNLNNIEHVLVPSIGKLPLGQDPGTFTPSGFNRNYKPGRKPEDGGNIKTSVGARLELNLNLKPGLDVTAVNNVENEDITVKLADGTVHMLMGASCENTLPIGNGETQVVFNAPISEQIS